jgi:Holliday junction resolvase RusA-like endonuclease
MKKIYIKLDGIPISQGRPRFARGVVYDPCAKQKKDLLSLLRDQVKGLKPLECPLYVEVIFYFPFAKSATKAFRKQNFHQPYCKRPDIDNLLKFYLDLLLGVVYKDDSLIVKVVAQKVYAAEGVTKIILSKKGESMVTEHILCYKKELNIEDLEYITRKANQLGYAGRDIHRTYIVEEENGEKHLYFECDEIKKKASFQKIAY